MRSFTIGDFRFDVISHDRVIIGEPPAAGESDLRTVEDRFVIDAFFQGQPLNWHPNQTGADDFPGIPNRTIYFFTGPLVVPVYQVFVDADDPMLAAVNRAQYPNLLTPQWQGLQPIDRWQDAPQIEDGDGMRPIVVYRLSRTKRGADFRGRFWRNLMFCAGRARLAGRLGRAIGDVTAADIDRPNNPDRQATRGTFVEPLNLRTMSIGEATAEVVG